MCQYTLVSRHRNETCAASRALENQVTASLTTVNNIAHECSPSRAPPASPCWSVPPARQPSPCHRRDERRRGAAFRATNEDWRKACDSDGVVSYYDYLSLIHI